MLRELAARHAYQRFGGLQSSPDLEAFAERVDGSDSFGSDAKRVGSLSSDFIYVPDDYKVQTGAKLTDNLFVGKPLGYGLQVQLLGHIAILQICTGTEAAERMTGWCLPFARC